VKYALRMDVSYKAKLAGEAARKSRWARKWDNGCWEHQLSCVVSCRVGNLWIPVWNLEMARSGVFKSWLDPVGFLASFGATNFRCTVGSSS
jgi:hypothetical protein